MQYMRYVHYLESLYLYLLLLLPIGYMLLKNLRYLGFERPLRHEKEISISVAA